MSTTIATEQVTLTLPKDAAALLRKQVASGSFASESALIESLLVASLFEPIDQDELTRWIDTEGVRRYDAMIANPSASLTHEQVFANLGIDEEDPDDAA